MGASALIALVLSLLQSVLSAAKIGGVPAEVVTLIEGAVSNHLEGSGHRCHILASWNRSESRRLGKCFSFAKWCQRTGPCWMRRRKLIRSTVASV